MTRTKKTGSLLFKLLLALCIILVLCLSYLLFFTDGEGHRFALSSTKTITVTNGSVEQTESALGTLVITKSDPYHVNLGWMPDSVKEKDVQKVKEGDVGFITILALFDAKGEIVYSMSTVSDSLPMTLDLDAGEYEIKAFFVTSEDDYVTLARKYLCSESSAPVWARNHNFAALAKDGTWNMSFSLEASSEGAAAKARATGMTLGLLIGFCLVFVMLAMANKSHRLESPKYDERQELERGRGFRYSFFTFLIYYSLMICMDFTGLVSSADMPFLYACGLFVAITVYVIYCIWHESYFAMNEKPKTLMILFAVIGILNMAITVMHVADGTLLHDGHFTYNSLNLLCAMMFFALFIAMTVKKLASSTKPAADDEDEEE